MVDIVSVEPDEPVIPVAGDSYAITCVVVQHAGLTLDPYITWTDSSGNTLLSSVTEKHNDSHYISRLTFDQIHLSQASGYACKVEQDSPALASPVGYSSDPLVILVEGMIGKVCIVCMYIHAYVCLSLHLVPPPLVNIEHEGPQYVGTNHTIACTIHLSSVIDIEVDTAVEWLQDGSPVMMGGERVRIETKEISPSVHKSTISFTPLTSLDDGAVYTCMVNISSASAPNVTESISSTNTILTVEGAFL